MRLQRNERPASKSVSAPPAARTEETGLGGNGHGVASLRIPAQWWRLTIKSARDVAYMFRRRTISIDVEGLFARVLVLEGREVVSWGTALIGAEDSEPPSESGGPSVQLRGLVRELPRHRGRMITSLLHYTTLARYLQLPKIGRRYLGQVIASEVLGTAPFSEDEVDIMWRARKTEAGQSALAVAVPKESVDQQMLMLRNAGCRPVAAYSRASALAFAVGVPDVYIVDLSVLTATIVLVQTGVPRAVHKADLPEEGSGPEQRADATARAVERVSSYREAQADGAENPSIPVCYVGQLATDEGLIGALEARLPLETIRFESPFKHPDHFPFHEYAANLGLIEADRAVAPPGRKSSERGWTTFNLLPERHLPRSIPWKPIGLLAAFVLLLYLASSLAGVVGDVQAERDTLASGLERMERQARTHCLTMAREQYLETAVTEAGRQISGLDSVQADFDRGTQVLLAQLEQATRTALPSGVALSSVSLQGGGLLLSGTAPSYARVIQYSTNLKASDGFVGTTIIRVDASCSGGGSGVVSFQITATFPAAPSADENASAGGAIAPE